MASEAAETVVAPSRASMRASSALRRVAIASSADVREAPAISSASERVRSTVSTWSRAPVAISSIAPAISSTERPASREVAVIRCDAAASSAAESERRPTSALSWAAIAAKAVPKTSRSERGWGGEVRSPRAMRPAASAASRR